ncbi:MAG: hypothetical protein AAF368_00750 [Planctomycetota bacterium]
MKLRGLSAVAFGAAAVSLCSLASAQLTVGDLSGPDLRRVELEDVRHERCLSLQFEDVYGVAIETEVTFTTSRGEVAVQEAGATCLLREVSDLVTLRFKNPLTERMQQMELDLRNHGSLNLRIRMDDAGNAKVVDVRQVDGALVRNTTRGDLEGFVLNGFFNAPNDDCANALDIGSAESFLYAFAPLGFSTDGPEACEWFGGTQIELDSWFRWTAPCTGIVFATNCDAALGDSKVAVYDSMCPTDGTAPLACNDDFCGPFFLDSAVAFSAVEGEEYLFRVGKSPNADLPVGGGEFTITCVAAPENDFCEDAISVSPGSSTMGTTFASTVDTNVPESCPGPFFDVPVDSPGVWYEVIGTGGEMRASICNSELGFLSRLTVYCAEGGCEDLTCVGAVRNQLCVSIPPLGVDPAVNWCSTEGAVYKILVHGALGFSGHFRLDVDDLGECLSDPVPCGEFIEKFGACCDGENCIQTTEGECMLLGGAFLGDGTDCCGNGLYELLLPSGTNAPVSDEATSLFDGLADDSAVVTPLGFCFDYFGETYDRVTVTTNGLLVFGNDDTGFLGAQFANQPIPDTNDPDNLIAVLWDDWVVAPSNAPGAGVFVETTGMPGARTFTCEWRDVTEFGDLGSIATFQAKLREETGAITTSWVSVPPTFPGDRTSGIENDAGTEGIAVMDDDIVAQTRALYLPLEDAVCGPDDFMLGSGMSMQFSHLDGGPDDLDGMADGVFSTGNMVLDGGEIIVDVPHATFNITGDLVMVGSGRIDGQTAFMQPETGPTICILACFGVDMADTSRITSRGSQSGGNILVCSERGSVELDDRAAINASAYNESFPGTQGGQVQIVAKQRVLFANYLTHATASGARAGSVSVAACGGFDFAVEIFGRLQAIGYTATGEGGLVEVSARKGGAFISTALTIRTEGGPFGQDGVSFVNVATQVTAPDSGLGDTVVSEGYPSSTPCSCAVADTFVPVPEEE